MGDIIWKRIRTTSTRNFRPSERDKHHNFINKEDISTAYWQDITYSSVLVSYGPENKDPNITRLPVGGDRVQYPRYCGTPTVSLLTVKLLLNIIISTPRDRYMTFDIEDFYPNKPMKQSEYMRLTLSNLPEDFTKQYKIIAKTSNDSYVYIKICKGMYGLIQAVILAQKIL